MERRLIALCLIAVGVTLQWGAGFGLITAGALLALSGLELGELLLSARQHWTRARVLAAAAPRRVAAAGLGGSAAVLLPLAALMAVGLWAALGTLGGIAGIMSAALGRE